MKKPLSAYLLSKRTVLALMLAPLPALAAYAPMQKYTGSGADDWLGSAATGVGDINSDGYGDIVVGVSFDDNNGTNSGSARVISGINGATLFEFNGDNINDYLGWSASGAGDVNNDGTPDILVGAFGDDNTGPNSGSARIYSGTNGAVLYTFNGTTASDFGFAVAAAGDVNNDGFDDVVVGAYRDDNNTGFNTRDYGRAQVFSGANGAVLYTFNGDAISDWWGYSVDGGNDVNNDGRPDIIVGSYAGGTKVFSGLDGNLLYDLNGALGSDWFGAAVAMAGDVNNDGYGDFIIGAFGVDTNGSESGSAVVYSGFDGAVLYTKNGDNAGDNFGRSVSGAGDLNNDGYDDFIVGAFNDDNNGTNSGSVTVYSGIDGTVMHNLNGQRAGDYFGFSVSKAGDVDNDTVPDFAVGAYLTNSLVDDSGTAYVFSGNPGAGLLDSDGDLVADSADPFDANPSEWADTDLDTTGDNTDTDDDGDGMPDAWEKLYRFNPLVDDSTGDADSDSDSNLLEYQNGTNPINVAAFAEDTNDFDNDGIDDLLLRSSAAGNWRLFNMANGVATGSGGYSNAVVNASWAVMATEDFDADGDTDVLIRNTSTGSWTMYETDGSVVINSKALGAYLSTDWTLESVADFDANGIKDLLLRNNTTNSWRVFYINNCAVSGDANMGLYTTGWSFQDAVDFDNDGDADILMRENANGYWRVFTIQSGVVSSNASLGMYSNAGWTLQVAEDLDNDGDGDIVLRGPSGDWRVFNIQNNAVVGNAPLALYSSSSWSLDHVNDVDNDGDTDLVLRSTTGGWRLFTIQNRAVTSNSSLALYSSTAWESVELADVNGNGVDDVIMRNTAGGDWRVFLINNGVVTINTAPGLYQSTLWGLQNP